LRRTLVRSVILFNNRESWIISREFLTHDSRL